MFKNILAHPKTSVAGVLLAILTAATVLQNVDWSHVTPQLVFGLVISLATAFLGLLAKDPGTPDTLSVTKSPKLPVWALICLLLVGTMPVQGCSVTTAEIKADGQAIASALNNVAAQLVLTNPTLAAQMTTAANSIAEITANWQTGSSLTLFNDAANAAEVVLSAIPITAPYASLVAIAVAAIDVLVANVNPSAVALRAEVSQNAQNLAEYRQMGRKLIKHRFLRSKRGDLQAAWNEAVKVNALQPSMVLR